MVLIAVPLVLIVYLINGWSQQWSLLLKVVLTLVHPAAAAMLLELQPRAVVSDDVLM